MINRAPLERLSGEDKDTKLPSCEMTMTGENLEGTLRGRSRQKTPSRRKQKSLNHVSRGVVAEKARRFRSCSRRSSIISIGATSRLALALQKPPHSSARTSKQKRAMEQTDDDHQESDEGVDADVDASPGLTSCEVDDSKSSCIPHSFLDATASHAPAKATGSCTSPLCGSSSHTDVGSTDGDGAPAGSDQKMKPESIPQAQSVTPTTSDRNGAPAASSQQMKPESRPQEESATPGTSDRNGAPAALHQREHGSRPQAQSEREETEPRTSLQTKYRQCRDGVRKLNSQLKEIAKRRTKSENEKPVMTVELGPKIKASEQTVADIHDWLLNIVRSMSKNLPLPDHIKNTLDGIETKMSSEPSPDRPPIDVVDESLVNLDQVLTELYRLFEWDECITEFVNLYEEFKPVPDGGGGASSLPALGTAPEMGVEQKKREEWLDRSLAAFMNYLVNGQNYALNLNPQLEKETGLCKLYIDQGEPDRVTLRGTLDDTKLCLESLREFIRQFKKVQEESSKLHKLKQEIGKTLAEHGVQELPAVDQEPKIGTKEYEPWLQKSVRQFMNYLVAEKQAHIPLCDRTSNVEDCTIMTKEGIERDLSAESPGLKHVERYLVALEEMWLCQQEFDGFADKWRQFLTRSSGTDVAGKLRQIYQPETAERGPSVTRDVQSEVRTIMERWMKSDVDERLRPDESTKEKLAYLLAAVAAQDLYSSNDVEELLDSITRRIDAGLNDLLTEIP